jgi:hypothetical protein
VIPLAEIKRPKKRQVRNRTIVVGDVEDREVQEIKDDPQSFLRGAGVEAQRPDKIEVVDMRGEGEGSWCLIQLVSSLSAIRTSASSSSSKALTWAGEVAEEPGFYTRLLGAKGGNGMSSESGEHGGRKVPQIDVRFDLDALDAAARERVERVIERSVSQELSKEPEAELARLPDTIILGIIFDLPFSEE